MFRRSKEKISTDYKKDIPQYTDEQIVEILKLRDHYQADAAKLAIEEAIKRGLIYSEQDLFAQEYKVEALEFSLFPKIMRAKNRDNIRKSIARSLVLSGAIPLVYGLVQINNKQIIEGGGLFVIGLLWLFFSAQLIRGYHKKFIIGLGSLNLFCFAYLALKLNELIGLGFFDYFIPIVFFLLIGYGLFFITRINKNA